jgi:hypothetical protein
LRVFKYWRTNSAELLSNLGYNFYYILIVTYWGLLLNALELAGSFASSEKVVRERFNLALSWINLDD